MSHPQTPLTLDQPLRIRASPAIGVYSPQTEACLQCGVRQFALFGALDETGLQRIHHQITHLHLDAGRLLYGAHQSGRTVYTIRSGVLRMERSSEGGERRVLRLAGKADLVGMEALLGQTYSADAVACTDLQVCAIPRQLIDELAAAQPTLTRDLMKRWQRALDDADEWLTELAQGSARHRMLRLLLKLSEYGQDDGSIWLPTRQDMGAMLAMTFETASRLVSAMRREGVLEPIDARHARLDMTALLEQLRAEGNQD